MSAPARGRRAQWAPHGLLAVAASTVGQVFDAPPVRAPEPAGLLAVVSIRGPLMHHCSEPWDCYDAIRCRVAEALKSDAQAVILAIDSPGGLVNGCFETATALKTMATAAGKPLLAYIDGQCCSAAYALACGCSKIYAPPTAVVGSIGVLDCIIDATAADRQMGLSFALVASGARKTDGNVHTATTEDAVSAAQARVDELAAYFFGFVAASRKGLSVADVSKLEANILTGMSAHDAGLVDRVLTLDDLLVELNAGARQVDAQLEGAIAARDEARSYALQASRALRASRAEARAWLIANGCKFTAEHVTTYLASNYVEGL